MKAIAEAQKLSISNSDGEAGVDLGFGNNGTNCNGTNEQEVQNECLIDGAIQFVPPEFKFPSCVLQQGLVCWFKGMPHGQNQVIWPFGDFMLHEHASPPGTIRNGCSRGSRITSVTNRCSRTFFEHIFSSPGAFSAMQWQNTVCPTTDVEVCIFCMPTHFPCVLPVFLTWLTAFPFQFAVQSHAWLGVLTACWRAPACTHAGSQNHVLKKITS